MCDLSSSTMSAYDMRLYDLERAAIVWALGTAAGSLKCLVRSKMSGVASPSLPLSGELFLGVGRAFNQPGVLSDASVGGGVNNTDCRDRLGDAGDDLAGVRGVSGVTIGEESRVWHEHSHFFSRRVGQLFFWMVRVAHHAVT